MTRLYLFVLVVSHSAFVTTQSLVDHAIMVITYMVL